MNAIDFTSAPGSIPALIAAIVGGLIVLAALAFGVRRYLRNRPSPADRERLRRLELNNIGKLKAGQVVDFVVDPDGPLIMYSYTVAGVQYSASQNVLALQSLVPGDAAALLGPTGVKFDPRNPANSIVVCEQWSGLQRVKGPR